MKSLKWQQVNGWRLSQHCLSVRLERQQAVRAATLTGGIQAQVLSAAELAMGTRVDGLLPQDVQAALWQERTLIKTWAMRATLHLLAADDLPLYVAARSVDESINWVRYFEYYGLSKSQLEAYLAAAPEILGSSPMTREQLATALAEHIGVPELRSLMITKSWGTPFKPLAWRGTLCFGPSDGQKVTFVNPRKWIGAWQPVEPYAALQDMARRYLRAYGPATVENFSQWWGLKLTIARKLFRSMEAELEPVEVEGWQAIALRETLEAMQNFELPGSVNLLPLFDAYVMGIGRGAEIEPLIAREHQRLVYRPQGWISAVVLVDGLLKGVWEYKARAAQTVIKAKMFSTPTAAIRSGIETEAQRLSAFWNSKIVVEYEDP
jgi:hypothetical protein